MMKREALFRAPAPLSWRRRLAGAVAVFSSSLVYVLVFGLALGALVHVAVIFAIPMLGSRDAVTRLGGAATVELDNGSLYPPLPDPAFVTTACGFDLTQGPRRISARTPDGFAGLSLHAPGGGVMYAVTDEVAQAGELVLVVMTPEQAIKRDLRARRGESVDDAEDIRFVMPARFGVAQTRGLAVYRVLAPRPAMREKSREAALTLSCGAE